MPNMFADLFNKIAEVAAENPLLGLLMGAALLGGSVLIGLFTVRFISQNYLAWFAASAQTVPFAMPILFADFVMENWGNHANWVIIFVFLVFLLLAMQINQFMRDIHTGGSGNGRPVIVILGAVGMFLWTLILLQIFLDVQVLTPLPPAPVGRP